MNKDGYPGPAAKIEGVDLELVDLIDAINSFPGIYTIDTCSGHGTKPIWIFFRTERLKALPPLLYWFDGCHTGEYAWKVQAKTDCAADGVRFMASSESLMGEEALRSAKQIAACMKARECVYTEVQT